MGPGFYAQKHPKKTGRRFLRLWQVPRLPLQRRRQLKSSHHPVPRDLPKGAWPGFSGENKLEGFDELLLKGSTLQLAPLNISLKKERQGNLFWGPLPCPHSPWYAPKFPDRYLVLRLLLPELFVKLSELPKHDKLNDGQLTQGAGILAARMPCQHGLCRITRKISL